MYGKWGENCTGWSESKRQQKFLSGPVVKTPCFYCQGRRFNPWSGNWDPTSHVACQVNKKKQNLLSACPPTPGSLHIFLPSHLSQQERAGEHVYTSALMCTEITHGYSQNIYSEIPGWGPRACNFIIQLDEASCWTEAMLPECRLHFELQDLTQRWCRPSPFTANGRGQCFWSVTST